jgi:pyruvate formate lyase activating enzyme
MNTPFSRRRFLGAGAGASCALAFDSLLCSRFLSRQSVPAWAQDIAPALDDFVAEEFGDESDFVKEAMHYKKLEAKRVECTLCPRACQVADRERGTCGVRENRDGSYFTLVHSRAVSRNIDPIEKKPLFHYRPGTTALSIATAGCNIECKFCQNWEISQFRPEQVRAIRLTPDRLVEMAREYDCPSIAYTYSEPVIFYEYMYDTGKKAIASGVGSVIISNGYIQEKALLDLLPQLTAVKIDLKAFTEKFYKDVCSGELKPVLDTLKVLKKSGMWFEIVVLLVPTLNDDPSEIREMCKWVCGELGPDVPMHFSRFHPTYRIRSLPPTPAKTLETAYRIAREEGVRYVYLGNVPGHKAESTYCPKCGVRLVHRYGYRILENRIREGKCSDCDEIIPGVWTDPLKT